MKLKIHQNQKDALLYGVSAVATRALGFILLPIYSRILSPDEFGLVSIALVISGLLQMVILPGFEGLYLRYGFQGYSKANSEENSKAKAQSSPAVGTIVRCHLLLAFVALPIFGLLALSFSKQLSPEVPSSFILFAIATLAAQSLQAPLVARFKASRTVKRLALFELAQLVLTAAVILVSLFVFHLGAVSLLLGDMVCALILLPITLREILRCIWAAPWLKEAFQMVAKSFFAVGPEALFYWALTAADRYALNYTHGAALTGIYVAGYQFGSIVISLFSIGARQWKVIIYQTYVENQNSRQSLRTLYRETFILFFILASFLAVMAKPLALTLLGNKFAQSKDIIPIVMTLVCFRIPMAYFSMYCWAKQYRRLVVTLNALSIVTFSVSLLTLVPAYGMKGAAWSGVIACVPFSIALHWLQINEFMFDSKYLRPRLIVAATALLLVLLTSPPVWVLLATAAGLLGALVLQARSYFTALATLENQR